MKNLNELFYDVILANELEGDVGAALRFSHAPGDKSGYSFGVCQFDVKNNDRDAKRIFEASIRAIVEGSISPDQDWRSVWKRMLTSTAEHFKSGAHVEN